MLAAPKLQRLQQRLQQTTRTFLSRDSTSKQSFISSYLAALYAKQEETTAGLIYICSLCKYPAELVKCGAAKKMCTPDFNFNRLSKYFPLVLFSVG